VTDPEVGGRGKGPSGTGAGSAAAAPGPRTEVVEVPPGEDARLDRFVAERLGLSRARVQRLVEDGHVTVDGSAARKSDRVAAGSRISVEIPAAVPVDIGPEDLPLDVVYEDRSVVVVNKAAGMVVHPAPGHRSGTLVNALLHHVRDLSGVGGRLRPGIVHRLDRDTSGLLVVAKDDQAHLALSDALRRRRVRRIYQAACWGHLPESPMTVDAPIGRDPRNRQQMAVVASGRRALTRARVRERWRRADLLDVALQTGRTHQIRVHLAHVGHPVVGDQVYGAGWERGMGGPDLRWARELARRTPRHFLHAAELAFDHPVTGEPMRFRAPLPPDLADVAAWARDREKP
jgi:23S rRNA pseudouridine1911/1915/1917 synthase